ncbi:MULTISPECIES: hypothetical protein [unclassified Nostoc]|uniref:hypothetical protein n=1 Tax=unclassified Nostoc TaxID=2593658 RepID=UPI003FA557B6
MMFVTAQQLEQQMPDATRLLSDEPEMETSLHYVYDRYKNHVRVFKLMGTSYEAISLPENRFWLEELELGLGLWQGSYQQTTGLWLRWYNTAGWVPTRREQAEQERQWAELEHQRAERLAEYLRSQGIYPDSLS